MTLLQRKETKVGAGLGKTTGWIHRTELKQRGVRMVPGVTYERIDDAGLHVNVDGTAQVLDVETIVVCTGQEPQRAPLAELESAGVSVQVIGARTSQPNSTPSALSSRALRWPRRCRRPTRSKGGV